MKNGLLPDLMTPAELKFCRLVAAGENRTDAFVAAFPDVAATKSRSGLHTSASRMASSERVQNYLRKSRELLEKKDFWDRARSVQVLASIATNERAKNADRISAVRALNTMHGYDAPLKIEVGGQINVNTLSDAELLKLAAIDVPSREIENLDFDDGFN